VPTVKVFGPNNVDQDPIKIPFGTTNTITWVLSGPGLSWAAGGVSIDALGENGVTSWPDASHRAPTLLRGSYVLTYTNNLAHTTKFKYTVAVTGGVGRSSISSGEPVIENQGGGPLTGGGDRD
jgi:hypothetical protein